MCQIKPIPYPADVGQLFFSLRDLSGAIWLDSGKPGSEYGRYDIISALPTATLSVNHGKSVITQSEQADQLSDDPFTLANNLLLTMPALPAAAQAFPFVGGLAGYFSYDMGKPLENIQQLTAPVATLPTMHLGLYHWSLIIDHKQKKANMVFLDSCPDSTAEEVCDRVQRAASSLNKPDLNPLNRFALDQTFSPSMSEQQYRQSIDRIQRYIQAGDCYQVNYAQHFSAPFHGDPLTAYLTLRRALPSPFSAWLNLGDGQSILCLSPERFLKANSDGLVETRPIKGTLRRGVDAESDQKNAAQLLASKKDRAENLMIVDLLRNDLGKTCEAGSISVPRLFALESFSNVHHLVSTITGKLRPDKSRLDLLKGCFPGGSITGAPKRRAMEIIEELETCQRSVYCGSIGYISRCGRMDTNIAIRTLVADRSHLHCWGGGGIVADSDASAEYQESLDKVQVLMDSLQAFKG